MERFPGRTQKEGSNSEKTTKVPALLALMSVRVIAATLETKRVHGLLDFALPDQAKCAVDTSETHDDERGEVILSPTAIPHHPYLCISPRLTTPALGWASRRFFCDTDKLSHPAGVLCPVRLEFRYLLNASAKSPMTSCSKCIYQANPPVISTHGQN